MASNTPTTQAPITIVVHGGAWAIPDSSVDASVAGCRCAAKAGFEVLSRGGTATEAVEAAVRVLEDDTVFDAGVGSVLNDEGKVEMDSMIMDGQTLSAGAVVGIDNVKHPVTVARHIQQSEHVMFAGEGAKQIASSCIAAGLADKNELVTESAIEEWKRFKKYDKTVSTLFDNEKKQSPNTHDTVGCVALDSFGHVAAATSTGGITAKKVGRVGDSPLVGSGGYADDAMGAVSTTGHGESIMKVVLAHRVLLTKSMNAGMSLQKAAENGLQHMKDRVSGYGGLVGVATDGTAAVAHTTSRMAWAYMQKKSQTTTIAKSGIKQPNELSQTQSRSRL